MDGITITPEGDMASNKLLEMEVREFTNKDATSPEHRHVWETFYLILSGDHLYRMDYSELVDAHLERRADITIAAKPVAAGEATGMGIFRFDADGSIVGFEEKPKAERLKEIGRSVPLGLLYKRAGESVPQHERLARAKERVKPRQATVEQLFADMAI